MRNRTSGKLEANSSKNGFIATEGMHHAAVKCVTIYNTHPTKTITLIATITLTSSRTFFFIYIKKIKMLMKKVKVYIYFQNPERRRKSLSSLTVV